MCCTVFIGAGYFYLSSKMKTPVKSEVKDIPYSYSPESAGILFDISGSKTLIYLDFEGSCVSAVFADDKDSEEIYGYPVDYTVSSDYSLLGGIIDILGGLELNINDENLTYTGVQVTDILTTTPHTGELRKEIIEKIFSSIADKGFSRNDFLYIIENSNTDLTVPDCYFWQDSMSEISKTVRIIQ